jgi:linoleoyl-CoA desaturase
MEKATKPRYAKSGDEAIFHQLRQDVKDLVQQLEPKRRGGILLKAVLFPAMYLFTYLAILLTGNSPGYLYTGYFLLGILLVMIFLNIIHDAVHGTIFNSKRWNQWYVYLFDLMGANSYVCGNGIFVFIITILT